MELIVSKEKSDNVNFMVIKRCIDYVKSLDNYPEEFIIKEDSTVNINDVSINKDIYHLDSDTEKIIHKILFPGEEYDIEKLKLCSSILKSSIENYLTTVKLVSDNMLSEEEIPKIDEVLLEKFKNDLFVLTNAMVKKMKKEIKSTAVIINDLNCLSLIRHSTLLQSNKKIEFIIAPSIDQSNGELYTLYNFYNLSTNVTFMLKLACAFEHIGYFKKNLTFLFFKEEIDKILLLWKKIKQGKFTCKITNDGQYLYIGNIRINKDNTRLDIYEDEIK